jgi:transcriptional regulator GlxA family with amidase domain
MTLTFDAELRCLYQSRSICREPAHLVLMPLMIIPIHRAHQYEERVGTLKENLDRKLTLEDLSSLVGMTAHQLLKAFRLCFDTSPAQFVIEQRLRRARWLLTCTNHDVAQIAPEAGFSSHSHLTATTRKRYGITPQEYLTIIK